MKCWIYQLRGLAILAVVVCHQQYILHTSETVQMLTLYSVTTLVFLMGYTNSLSYKKNKGRIDQYGYPRYLIRKILPIILSYIIVSIVFCVMYDINSVIGIIKAIFTFSAAQLLYFIKYYIVFTLVSPLFIYCFVCFERYNKTKYILYALLISMCMVLGSSLNGRINWLGGSYLAIYVLGMSLGYEECKALNNKRTFIFGIILLVLGLFWTNRFYTNWVMGMFEPIGLDRLFPRLHMNPPNISIITYSMGIILTGKVLFEWANTRFVKGPICFFMNGIMVLGKFSLDIYLWHIIIQNMLERCVDIRFWIIKCIIYYSLMLFLPVLGRVCYNKIKSMIKVHLSTKESI